MSRVRSGHHILSIEHLLSEFWDSHGSVLLRATSCQRCEADHEEVQTGERNQIDGHLSQVRVQLTREPQASCDSGHNDGDKVVEVTVCWC